MQGHVVKKHVDLICTYCTWGRKLCYQQQKKLKNQQVHCVSINTRRVRANSPDNAGWDVHIIQRDDFPELLQTVDIFDFTAELGAVEPDIRACLSRRALK